MKPNHNQNQNCSVNQSGKKVCYPSSDQSTNTFNNNKSQQNGGYQKSDMNSNGKNASSSKSEQNGSYKRPELDYEVDEFEEIEETNKK